MNPSSTPGPEPLGQLAALAEMAPHDPRRDDVVASFDACSAIVVATSIFERYRTLGRSRAVQAVLARALDRLGDAAAVADAFLAAWRQGAPHEHGELALPDAFLDAIARVPSVAAQMAADVAAAGHEADRRRGAEAAIDLIARDRSDRGLRAIIELVRARRHLPRSWGAQAELVEHAHARLGHHGDRRAVPTLLLFLGSMRRMTPAHAEALYGLVRLDPERARPLVLAAADRHACGCVAVKALALLGGAETIGPLIALARYPVRAIHDRAAQALRRLGVEPPAFVRRAPEELVAHPDLRVRHDAQRAIVNRRHPSTFVSLVAAQALEAALRARIDQPGLPFSWWEWEGVIPRAIIEASPDEKLAWAHGAGRAALGAQVVWPAVAPILRDGALRTAAAYSSPLLAFPPAVLDVLEDEEAAVLESLDDRAAPRA